jgi:alpha-L-rhamnosidase
MKRAPDFRGKEDGNTWGDWLNVNEETPIAYVDACYFAQSARRMAEMAEALEKPNEASKYGELFEKARDAWRQDYLRADGSLSVDTQSAYVLALDAGLPSSEAEEAALASKLAAKIQANSFKMATGFLGTKPLLQVLTDNGFHDLALRLYQSRDFPSWGYEVVNGATTVWERWDSFTKEHGFEGFSGKNNASMNSFSHYAFGAVNEWAYSRLAGIDTIGAGYKRIALRPGPPSERFVGAVRPLDFASAELESPRGTIKSSWRRVEGGLDVSVEVPPNTRAVLYLPVEVGDEILEGGEPF